jgi:hypothetical protein
MGGIFTADMAARGGILGMRTSDVMEAAVALDVTAAVVGAIARSGVTDATECLDAKAAISAMAAMAAAMGATGVLDRQPPLSSCRAVRPSIRPLAKCRRTGAASPGRKPWNWMVYSAGPSTWKSMRPRSQECVVGVVGCLASVCLHRALCVRIWSACVLVGHSNSVAKVWFEATGGAFTTLERAARRMRNMAATSSPN